jgi:hypothetical protein
VSNAERQVADAKERRPAVALDPPRAGRGIRRILLGPRPLTRATDRPRLVAQVVLLATLLASIPIAFAVAVSTYTGTHLQAVAQAAERHPVSATLLENAPVLDNGSDEAVTTSRAAAVWTEASGKKQKGSVLVTAGTAAGSTIRIWLDRAGHVTGSPLTDGDAVARAVGHALVTVLLVVMCAFAAYGAALRALAHRRDRRWATEWATVEPLWTRQSS